MKGLLITAPALLLSAGLFAHDGHGHTGGYTIIHYLTEPVHAVSLVLAFVAGLLLWRRTRRGSIRK